VVKQTSALKYAENSNRFRSYYIDNASQETFATDPSILKKYSIGDTIVFHTARKFFSNHVGDTYYLMGTTTLDNGETVTFEYGASFEYSPAIWETLEEFLERRDYRQDFP